MSCSRIGTSYGWDLKSCPQNRILVPLRGSFQNLQQATPSFFMWEFLQVSDNIKENDLPPIKGSSFNFPYATSSGTRVAYFPYDTFVSVVSFNDVTILAFCFC